MTISIVNLVHWVFPNIDVVIWSLILQSLVLGCRTLNTILLEVLRLHQLLVGLCVRLHIDGILHKFKVLPLSSLLLLHVLARGRRGRKLFVVAATNRSLCRNWSLWLHEVGWVHLVSRKHLFCWATEGWPDRLPAINTGRRHTLHSRHRHQTASLHEITGWLSVYSLVVCSSTAHILHCHWTWLLDRGATMPTIIVLQKRMMTLLLIINTIDVVLGSISRFNIRQEAIIAR